LRASSVYPLYHRHLRNAVRHLRRLDGTPGAGDFFIGFPYALTCGSVAARQTAIVASCLFAPFPGSATANTAATGSFTIPLMIKSGYPTGGRGRAIEPPPRPAACSCLPLGRRADSLCRISSGALCVDHQGRLCSR
jgi:hypothetical protein